MMINTKKSSSSSPSKQQKRHKNPNNKTDNQNCGGRRRRRSYIISFVLPITVVIVLSLLQLFGFSPSASLSLIISKNDDLYLYLIPSSGGGDNTTTTTTTTTSRRHREESSSEETIPVPNGGLISILKQYPQHNNNSNNYIKNNKQRLPRRKKTNIYILNDDECCRFQKNTNFFSTNAQGKHLLIDGMQRSNILQRTYDPHNNNSTTVWFYLLIREFQCTSILKRIEESIIERQQQQQYQQQKQHQKRMLKRNKKSGKNKNKNRNKKQTTSKVAAPVEFDTSIPIPAWDIYILDSSDGGFIQSPNQRYSGCIKQMDQLMSSLDNNYYNHYNHNNNRTTTNADNEDNNSSTDHRHRHRIHMVTRTMVKGRGIKFEDELFIKAINKIDADADADADTNITDTDTNVTDNKPSPSPLTPPPIILLENNNSKPFGPLGEKIDWLNHSMSNYIYGGIPRQFRYFVRSDMIDWIENEFNGTLYYNYSTSSRTSTSSISASSSNSNTQKQERRYIDLVYGGNRTIADVAHFTSRKDTLQLRGHINQFLIKMEEDQKKRQQQQQQQPHNNDTTPTNSNNNDIKFFIGIAGGTGKYGRKSAQDKYCDMLLGSKIIIVGQRPRWEDHWRLMEALTFGGLVFTDSYVGDMPYGLIENESIIIYRNIMQLKEKIVYYLKPENEVERLRIAYKGHHTAIDFHRSYQYLERIIFEEYPI
jgi:hypothetical protein